MHKLFYFAFVLYTNEYYGRDFTMSIALWDDLYRPVTLGGMLMVPQLGLTIVVRKTS